MPLRPDNLTEPTCRNRMMKYIEMNSEVQELRNYFFSESTLVKTALIRNTSSNKPSDIIREYRISGPLTKCIKVWLIRIFSMLWKQCFLIINSVFIKIIVLLSTSSIEVEIIQCRRMSHIVWLINHDSHIMTHRWIN